MAKQLSGESDLKEVAQHVFDILVADHYVLAEPPTELPEDAEIEIELATHVIRLYLGDRAWKIVVTEDAG